MQHHTALTTFTHNLIINYFKFQLSKLLEKNLRGRKWLLQERILLEKRAGTMLYISVGRQNKWSKTKSRPRRNWIDDIKEWSNVKDHCEPREVPYGQQKKPRYLARLPAT